MLEIIDFFMGILTHIGNYFKIHKKSYGWLISMVAIIWWIFRAGSLGLYSQSFWSCVSFCIASYGFYSWSEKKQKDPNYICLSGGCEDCPKIDTFSTKDTMNITDTDQNNECQKCRDNGHEISNMLYSKHLAEEEAKDLKFRNSVLEEKCNILQALLLNKDK